MIKFFARNIDVRGRLARLATAMVLVFLGVVLWRYVAVWAGVITVLAAGFTFFEAARGWCVLRACGIKTKL